MISKDQYNLLKQAVSERKTSSSNGITGIYIYKYKVSQSGEAEMYLFKSSFYKWWVPVVISIGAFVVSIIALFR